MNIILHDDFLTQVIMKNCLRHYRCVGGCDGGDKWVCMGRDRRFLFRSLFSKTRCTLKQLVATTHAEYVTTVAKSLLNINSIRIFFAHNRLNTTKQQRKQGQWDAQDWPPWTMCIITSTKNEIPRR